MAVNKYTKEDHLKIKSMLDNRNTAPEIALALGRTVSAIRAHLKTAGGMTNYAPFDAKKTIQTQMYTIEERTLIKTELEKGNRIVNIARSLGRSFNSVRHEIRENGGAYNYVIPEERKQVIQWNSRVRIKDLQARIQNIEFQLEIITDTLQELLNDRKN